LEEINELFARRVPARQWNTYVLDKDMEMDGKSIPDAVGSIKNSKADGPGEERLENV
jgi:hypothetical protein